MHSLMNSLRRHALAVLPAAAFALAPQLAAAQSELRFATGQAPDSMIMQRAYGPWAEAINTEGAGLVNITAFPPPFATATNMWDRVTAGVADIGVIALNNTGLPLTAALITSLPGLGGDTEAASVALWRLYEQGLLDDQLDEVRVLGFQAVMPLHVYTREPVNTLEDLAGLRVRVTDATTAASMTALGAVPSAIPFAEAYQAVSRGVVDAALGNGNSMVVFRFRELLGHEVSNMAFGMTGFIFGMNKDSYEALSPEARAVVDSWSGERLSRFLGASQNELREDFNEDLVSSGDLLRTDLSEAELAIWQERLAPVTANWIANTPNGQAVYDAYIAAYNDAAAGH